ncbi:N-lysine methyltransferase KMT5A [Holothuria leucospilota]|uniref:N-lysine methyltransferase KMT5A n=1 Tax=Holothuria leucospilota TaxID=206669 RepID=A0A9Q1C4X6_HOLLE|nr:N-lysine methyltransferase KMT5A [Holothuria leucospilota]
MSRRKPRRNPLSVATHFVHRGVDQPGFTVKKVSEEIGLGVFAEREFQAGEFLLEYRENVRNTSDTEGDDQTYIFHFQKGKKKLCIDATSSTCIAKMINDEWRTPNCKIKRVDVDDKPILLIFALTCIKTGQELRYDYGQDSAPWRLVDYHVPGPDPDEAESSEEETGKDLPVPEDMECSELNNQEPYPDKSEGSKQENYHVPGSDPDEADGSGEEDYQASGPDEAERSEEEDYQASGPDEAESSEEENYHVPGSDPDEAEGSEEEKMSSPEEDNLSHVSESDVESCASEVIPIYHRPVRNQSGVKVLTSSNCDGRRVWDKHQYCVYCNKAFAKLPRHLESAHSGERDVAEALMYDKKSKERSKRWEILRNKGNHSHNVEVLKKGEGFIIPVKRPTQGVPVSCYLPCKQCLGYYVAKDMWKHLKQCPLTEEKKRQSKHLRSECALLLPMADATSSAFREKVLAKMINDDVSWLAKNDETILQLGQRIMGSVDDAVHMFQYVSQKMRQVARFLLVVRDLNPELQTIQDSINPKYFDTVVQGVKLSSGYDSGGNTYKTPSLALKLGHSIRKCAMIVKSKRIKTDEEELQRRGNEFDDPCANDWAAAVSSRAL